MATCRDCGATIRFVTIKNTGRALPINPTPDRTGNVVAWSIQGVRWFGLVLGPQRAMDADLMAEIERTHGLTQTPFLYRPHHADCNQQPPPATPDPEPTDQRGLW